MTTPLLPSSFPEHVTGEGERASPSYNRDLASVPDCMMCLETLHVVRLRGCKLTTLPKRIHLPNLKELYIWGNELILEEEYDATLPALEKLSAGCNPMKQLSASLLKTATAL